MSKNAKQVLAELLEKAHALESDIQVIADLAKELCGSVPELLKLQAVTADLELRWREIQAELTAADNVIAASESSSSIDEFAGEETKAQVGDELDPFTLAVALVIRNLYITEVDPTLPAIYMHMRLLCEIPRLCDADSQNSMNAIQQSVDHLKSLGYVSTGFKDGHTLYPAYQLTATSTTKLESHRWDETLAELVTNSLIELVKKRLLNRSRGKISAAYLVANELVSVGEEGIALATIADTLIASGAGVSRGTITQTPHSSLLNIVEIVPTAEGDTSLGDERRIRLSEFGRKIMTPVS